MHAIGKMNVVGKMILYGNTSLQTPKHISLFEKGEHLIYFVIAGKILLVAAKNPYKKIKIMIQSLYFYQLF